MAQREMVNANLLASRVNVPLTNTVTYGTGLGGIGHKDYNTGLYTSNAGLLNGSRYVGGLGVNTLGLSGMPLVTGTKSVHSILPKAL